MYRVAILGPGGVGGLVAAALARAGQDVTVVAREATAEHIAREGIRIDSVRLGSFTARPRAVSILCEPTDVLIVATKAAALEQALDRIQVQPLLVVPLLNGLEHLEILRARFGSRRVAAGTIRVESERTEAGRIAQTSPFLRVEVASYEAALRVPLERLVAALQAAGIPAKVCPSEAQIMWTKLARLNALSSTTSASDRPIGFVRSDPHWRAELEGAVAESVAVARAEGVPIDPAETLAELEAAHAELRSSMQRDIAAGREPELDAIQGAVLRAGARHGIQCPTIARLSEQIARRAGTAPPRV